MSGTPVETERKFLIKMPDIVTLTALDGLQVKQIEQTYLLTDGTTSSRVRRIVERERTYFVKTVKKRISTLSCYEDENEISDIQYNEELKNADPQKSTILKTRYAFPFHSHTVEIDIYPFWNDRAILEIEMNSEDEKTEIPEFIEVIKEVSEDKRYKNTNLARKVPMDKI